MSGKSNGRNVWKVAFFVLAAGVFISVAGVFISLSMMLSGNRDSDFERPDPPDIDGASFTVTTSKDDLNYWLQSELGEEAGSDDYDLYIEDLVYMETEVTAFGIRIPIQMTLAPYVTENGNLELREDSFTVANINLPSDTVFQLIESRTDLPEWITVVPEESLFYVNVREVSEDADIRAESFDLENDDISFVITFNN